MKSEIASEKQTDLDKSVKEIEELLSQKYGSSPYESSVNYDQSDSDFNPWESSKNSDKSKSQKKAKIILTQASCEDEENKLITNYNL